MLSEYSIWLLPKAQDEALLTSHIAVLSMHLGGPVFSPHVTVQGDITLPRDQLDGPLSQLAKCIPPQRWRIEQVEVSEHFFRCLYLRFATGPAFADMQHTAQAITRTSQGQSPFPHLSLAYGESHPGMPQQIEPLSEILQGKYLVFDRLALCHSSKNVPIAKWRCLEQYPLCGL